MIIHWKRICIVLAVAIYLSAGTHIIGNEVTCAAIASKDTCTEWLGSCPYLSAFAMMLTLPLLFIVVIGFGIFFCSLLADWFTEKKPEPEPNESLGGTVSFTLSHKISCSWCDANQYLNNRCQNCGAPKLLKA